MARQRLVPLATDNLSPGAVWKIPSWGSSEVQIVDGPGDTSKFIWIVMFNPVVEAQRIKSGAPLFAVRCGRSLFGQTNATYLEHRAQPTYEVP